ncbi:MAG TPA: beta-galactosidase [bacterium]|nr:beta-galactosidase [bacterium]
MMKKILLFSLIFPLFAAARHNGDYLHVITTSYVTPHLVWGKPLSTGKIKCLFIVGRQGAREVVELWQRMDLDYEAVTVFHSGLLAMEDMYEGQVEGTTAYEKKKELLTKLEKDYDVFILGNVRFDILPSEVKYRILEKVKNGAGLVFFYNHGTIYKKIFASPEKIDWVSQGLSLKSLPFSPTGWTPGNLLTPEKKFRVEELLKGYQFGQGRILVVSYPGHHSTYYSGLTLTNPEKFSRTWKSTYESYLVLAGRCLLWAARREKGFSLTPVNFQNEEVFSQEKLPALLTFRWQGPEKVRVLFRLRNEGNEVVYQEKVSPQAGEPGLRLPFVKAGRYFLDYVVLSEKGADDFGFFSLQMEGRLKNLTLETDKVSYQTGETIKGKFSFEGNVREKTELLVEVSDTLRGRTYLQQKHRLNLGVASCQFEIPVEGFPSLAGYLSCSLVESGQTIAEVQKEIFFPKRERELFPNILWGGLDEYLAPLYLPRLLQAGFTASLNHPSEEGRNARLGALFNLKMVPYMYRIMLSSDEKGWTQEQWLRTAESKNKEKYNGDGSFYNPVVQKEAKEVILKRMTNLPLYGPLVYNLGDENFFRYEGGFSPSDEKAFRNYLKEKYGRIELLNQEWEERFTSFEEVKHYPLKEAAQNRKYAAWYDHRCFMEKQYADYHHYLSRIIKEVDPQAEVGAEGSVPGNLEETISQLEFWGPYADKIGNELLRSIGGNRLRTNWWGGYVGSHGGRDAYPYPLWKPLLCGIVNGNSWYAAGPSSEGFLGVDFSYAEYFEKMLPRLNRLNGGLAQLLVVNSFKNDGLAVHWSPVSDAVSLLGEPFLSPKNSIGQLIDFCYRHGFHFEFLTTRMVEEGKLSGYKIFFLFGSSAITAAEKKEIEKFVSEGGIVVADMNPGILNGYGRFLKASQLNDLFGVSLRGEARFTFQPLNIDRELRGKKIAFQAEKVQSSPEAELFQVNQIGKGLAILLNFDLNSAFNTSSRSLFDQFLSGLLALAEIKKDVEVSGLNEEKTVLRLRENPDFKLVGLLCAKEDVGKKLKMKLDRKYFIYRCDEGFIREGESLEETVGEPFIVYALFGQKQARPAVQLESSTIKRGEKVTIVFSSFTPGRIYRLRLYGPQEELFRQVCQVQKKLYQLTFPCNGKPGAYRVEVTDVATGLKETLGLKVL